MSPPTEMRSRLGKVHVGLITKIAFLCSALLPLILQPQMSDEQGAG